MTIPLREQIRLETTFRHLPDAESYLDCGGGVGHLAQLIRDSYPRAFVLLSDLVYSRICQHNGISIAASATALPLPSNSFEVVVSTEMLEHISEPNHQQAIEELQRVTSGRLIITVPNAENLERALICCADCHCVYHPHGHLRSYSRQSTLSLFPSMKSVTITTLGRRRFRPPALASWAARRIGLVKVHLAGEPCPKCGSNSFRVWRPPLRPASFLPSFRRPWLMIQLSKNLEERQ